MAIRAPDGANKFRFSFSIPLQNERKKGQGIMSNISPKKMVHRYLHNTIFSFKLKFHLEDGLVDTQRLFFVPFFLKTRTTFLPNFPSWGI